MRRRPPARAFIEDINSILSNGEVPNLFPPGGANAHHRGHPARGAQGGQGGQQRHHLLLLRRPLPRQHPRRALPVAHRRRPSGTRLRQFPSLVNCTTIDWFHPWPTEALKQVATHFLQRRQPGRRRSRMAWWTCAWTCRSASTRCRCGLPAEPCTATTTSRPTSYLELIKLFRQLFESTRTVHQGVRSQRYQTGLAKLMRHAGAGQGHAGAAGEAAAGARSQQPRRHRS